MLSSARFARPGFRLGVPGPTLAVGAVVALANAVLLVLLIHGQLARAIVVAALPIAVGLLGWLVVSDRSILVFAALGLGMVGGSWNGPLPIGANLYPADVIVALAVGAWLVSEAVRRPVGRDRSTGPGLLRVPLLLFALAVAQAAVRGHVRYGANLLGTPLRLVLYAAIATAVTRMDAKTAWRGILAVFYAGTVIQCVEAVRLLATGGSQTGSLHLSTGGTRILALSTSIYLSGALILALLNLAIAESTSARLLHVAIAALAAFGVVVAFGRATYLTLLVVVPVVIALMRRVRRSLVAALPVWLPAVVIACLLVPRAAPHLAPTLESRVTSAPASDLNVRWRRAANAAVERQARESPYIGVGFGRGATFELDGVSFRIDQDPHNDFLFLLAAGGIVTLAAFLLVLLASVANALRRLRAATGHARILVIWALASAFCFLANGLSGPVLPTPSMLLTIWILLLLPNVVPIPSRALRTAPADAGIRTTAQRAANSAA